MKKLFFLVSRSHRVTPINFFLLKIYKKYKRLRNKNNYNFICIF